MEISFSFFCSFPTSFHPSVLFFPFGDRVFLCSPGWCTTAWRLGWLWTHRGLLLSASLTLLLLLTSNLVPWTCTSCHCDTFPDQQYCFSLRRFIFCVYMYIYVNICNIGTGTHRGQKRVLDPVELMGPLERQKVFSSFQPLYCFLKYTRHCLRFYSL